MTSLVSLLSIVLLCLSCANCKPHNQPHPALSDAFIQQINQKATTWTVRTNRARCAVSNINI